MYSCLKKSLSKISYFNVTTHRQANDTSRSIFISLSLIFLSCFTYDYFPAKPGQENVLPVIPANTSCAIFITPPPANSLTVLMVRTLSYASWVIKVIKSANKKNVLWISLYSFHALCTH